VKREVAALVWGGFVASFALAATALDSVVEIHVESPRHGAAVRNPVHQAPIRGNAMASGVGTLAFDVMIVLDISGSTKIASGVDVDGDGETGFSPEVPAPGPGGRSERAGSTDPGDTILAAEVAAADALIANLETGGRVRVGIISFSGEMNPNTGRRVRYDQQDAWLEVPLTADFAVARARLSSILARGPYGGTNFAAGLRLAIAELAALSGSHSVPRPDARKVVLFLTDGLPTFPQGTGSVSDPGDVEASLAAARLAQKAGITINSYALGPTALTNPFAATELARLTSGAFFPVRKPGDIVSFLQTSSFASVDDVIFTNLTTREVSTDVQLSPDGSFDGFVPVREGRNRVRVTALASDGSQGSVELDVLFEADGVAGRDLSLELERIRERNKQLLLTIERDGVKRFREQQRKVIEFAPETEL
jgi:hypothetical protein